MPLLGPAAKEASERLLAEFDTIAGVLAAEPERMRAFLQDQTSTAEFLLLLRSAMRLALQAEVMKGPIFSTMPAVLDYTRMLMAGEPAEQFRVFFLNAQNRLLRDEVVSLGSVREAPVYVREIMRRALQLGATALILVHNHPSGDPQPSLRDIAVTREIVESARLLDICVHDHLIVARSGTSSLRVLGLL